MNRTTHPLELTAAWILALLWLAPLGYALWSSIHPAEFSYSGEPGRLHHR